MRRAVAALLLATPALALAGCGGHHGPSGSPASRAGGDRPPDPRAQLQLLLDRRAAALQAGDVAAYAATAAGAQRRRDRAAGRIAAGIALRDVRLQLRAADVGDGRAALRVSSSWGVRGIRGTFVTTRRMQAVRGERGWRIESVGAGRERPPWEVGDYVERRLAHFTVLAPRSEPLDAAGLPASLEAGYAALRALLPRAPLRDRYLVVVTPTAADARRLTADIRGVEGLAAISDTAVHESGPARRVTAVLSQRLLVIWPAFEALTADERRRVVAHELTHAVLAGSTSGRTPSWLVEGIALYVSGDDRRNEVAAVLGGGAGSQGQAAREAFSLAALSRPNAIARLGGAPQAGAYAYASAAAFTIAARYGRRALLRLYDAFNDERLAGAPGARLTDRALRRTTGEGLAALEEQIRSGL